MRLVRLAVTAFVLLTPLPSTARPILFEVTYHGELSVDFGFNAFEFFGNVDSSDVVLVDGSAELVSGPLLDLQVDDINGRTSLHLRTWHAEPGIDGAR